MSHSIKKEKYNCPKSKKEVTVTKTIHNKSGLVSGFDCDHSVNCIKKGFALKWDQCVHPEAD